MTTWDTIRADQATALAGVQVCLVGINYAPETTGIGPYTTAMARTWAAAGADVTVVTGVPHYPAWKVQESRYRGRGRWQELDGQIRLHRVGHHVPSTPDLRGRARMESTFFSAAAREVRRTPSDVVIAVTPSIAGAAAAAAAARGRPVGIVVQDLTGRGALESGSTGSRVASLIGRAEYSLLRRATTVGVIASQFRVSLVAQAIPDDRIVDVANFAHVEASPLSAAEARAALGWRDGPFRVVHTGNMGMKQGLEHVVDAARAAQDRGLDVEFVLVGDGNRRRELEQYARGVDTIRFVDPVDEDSYPHVLAAADALLLNERPGVREMCLPSKLTSYTVARRPILAAVEPGGISHAALTGSGAAHLVTPGSGVALLDGLLALMDSPRLRGELAEAAAAYGDATYGRSAASARYIDLVHRTLDGARSLRPAS